MVFLLSKIARGRFAQIKIRTCNGAVCISRLGKVCVLSQAETATAPAQIGKPHGVCQRCDDKGLPSPYFSARATALSQAPTLEQEQEEQEAAT